MKITVPVASAPITTVKHRPRVATLLRQVDLDAIVPLGTSRRRLWWRRPAWVRRLGEWLAGSEACD